MGVLAIWALAVLGAIAAWIAIGVMSSKRGGAEGRKFYFIQLGLCLASIALVFGILIIPSMNCTGYLCGLAEALIFMIVGAIVLLSWPLILIGIIKKKFNTNQSRPREITDGLIDDLENE